MHTVKQNIVKHVLHPSSDNFPWSLRLYNGRGCVFCNYSKMTPSCIKMNSTMMRDTAVSHSIDWKLTIYLKRWNFNILIAIETFYGREKKKKLAERGFDPRTSGLWAQHASTAPLCWYSLPVNIKYISRVQYIDVIYINERCTQLNKILLNMFSILPPIISPDHFVCTMGVVVFFVTILKWHPAASKWTARWWETQLCHILLIGYIYLKRWTIV